MKKKTSGGDTVPLSLDQLAAHAPEMLITFRVSVLAQLLSRTVDVSVRESIGLTSRQWRVLVMLNRLGSTTSGDVARMANFDHSQVSRVAAELVQKGLVEQNNDAADRRRQMLALTPAGIESLRQGVPGSRERERRLRARLTPAEYDAFCRAVEVLGDEAQVLLAECRSRGGVAE